MITGATSTRGASTLTCAGGGAAIFTTGAGAGGMTGGAGGAGNAAANAAGKPANATLSCCLACSSNLLNAKSSLSLSCLSLLSCNLSACLCLSLAASKSNLLLSIAGSIPPAGTGAGSPTILGSSVSFSRLSPLVNLLCSVRFLAKSPLNCFVFLAFFFLFLTCFLSASETGT